MRYSSLLSTPTARQKGFTLIEILIAVVVVGLVLTAVTAVLTTSVKNAAESRYRARATTLGQEAVEAFSREKSLLGWGEFLAFFPVGTTTYCLENVPEVAQLRNLAAGACNVNQSIEEAGVTFTREAQVIKSAANAPEITVNTVVRWQDGTRTPEVLLTRVYRKTD